MSHSPTSLGTLLWIGPTASVVYRAVEQAAAAAAINLQTLADPYVALAHLGMIRAGRSKVACPPAIAVHLDALETRDLEFLQLVVKHYPDLSVWVTGDSISNCRMELALRLGARQQLTSANAPVLLAALAARRELTAPDAEPRGPMSSPFATSPAQGVPAANPSERSEVRPLASPGDRANPQETKCEAPSRPMPVPWVRNLDAPQRTPPPRMMRVNAESTEEEIEADSPLLTDEELEAFIGREARRREARS